MKTLNWKNAFNWMEKLDSTEKQIAKMTERFCKERLQYGLPNDYQNGYGRDLFQLYGSNGFFEKSISPMAQGLISHEIESIDSGYRSAWSVQSSLAMYSIEKFGTALQKEKYLPDLASGQKIGCFGLTESGAGSDPKSMNTSAIKIDDKILLNGEKMWITNAPIADIMIIWAKDQDSQVGGYIVQKSNPNVFVEKIKNKLSLQTSPTGIIYLNDVVVDIEDKLNVRGMRGPLTCLNKARYGIAWGSLGAARDCLENTIDYATYRNQFGKPLISFQLIQSEIADMASEWIISMSSCYALAEMINNMENPFDAQIAPLISVVKRNSTIKSLNIARRCRDILGANGIVNEISVMRHMCNLESVITYEGTQSMHLLNIGRAITGQSAFT